MRVQYTQGPVSLLAAKRTRPGIGLRQHVDEETCETDKGSIDGTLTDNSHPVRTRRGMGRDALPDRGFLAGEEGKVTGIAVLDIQATFRECNG